ncbi:MAG TPA: glycosyltransferase family 2 protein [Candidatus Binatia bacterium]|nr:glycosyltransferase family 2 protein [Candidatus Binatia bacterium]
MGLNMECRTPIALFVFNRPALAARVFEAIRQVQPRKLYLVADGPRVPEDEPKCQASRALAEQVDWPCDVLTNVSETNLGAGLRVASGLDWVFSQSEEAIILEDDCLPDPSFFGYCEELLARYRDDRRVMHIAGSSFLPSGSRCKYSYYFSKYALGWGWASWKRAWRHFQFSIPTWPAFKCNHLARVCPDRIEAAHWIRRYDPIHRGERKDAWDYQWSYALWEQHGLAVAPAVNLVKYLGIGADATHTKDAAPCRTRPTASLSQVSHPPTVTHDADLDRVTFDEFYGGHRMRRRASLSYQLSKPLRLWRGFQARFSGDSAFARSGTMPASS